MKKIGLLGGSFDPIHNAHLALARAALRQLKLDRVYFVLSPKSPFKLKKRRTSPALRLRMLKLALAAQPKFKPGLWELKQRGASYTVDSLRRFHKKHPSVDAYFIMGSDSFKDFGKWRKPDEILKLARPVVGLRPGTGHSSLPARYRKAAVVLKGRFPAISSTFIRKTFSLGRVPKNMIPLKIASFIKANKLY